MSSKVVNVYIYQEEYAESLDTGYAEVGIKFQVHSKSSAPDVENQGLAVGTGRKVYAGFYSTKVSQDNVLVTLRDISPKSCELRQCVVYRHVSCSTSFKPRSCIDYTSMFKLNEKCLYRE